MSDSTPLAEMVRILRESHDKYEVMIALDPFFRKAGWITRSIHPYTDIECVLGYEPPTSGPEIKIYEMIVALHPQFIDLLDLFYKEDDDSCAYSEFLSHMRHRMNGARNTDTSLFKANILDFLPDNSYTPIASNRLKDLRGFHHKVTARALCLLSMVEDFDKDPIIFMKQVENGSIKLRVKDLPSFMYPEGTLYDANNLDKGLCKSEIIIKGLRLVYTGPSSTDDGRRAQTKPSQAEMHGMRAVTGRTVAYVACHIYFSLSSSPNWETKIGKFNLQHFFTVIVDYFERDPKDPWAIDTLRFLTNAIPALKQATKRKHTEASDSEDDSDIEDPSGVMKARAAKRAAEAEAAAERGLEHHEREDGERDGMQGTGNESETQQEPPTRERPPSNPAPTPPASSPSRALNTQVPDQDTVPPLQPPPMPLGAQDLNILPVQQQEVANVDNEGEDEIDPENVRSHGRGYLRGRGRARGRARAGRGRGKVVK